MACGGKPDECCWTAIGLLQTGPQERLRFSGFLDPKNLLNLFAYRCVDMLTS